MSSKRTIHETARINTNKSPKPNYFFLTIVFISDSNITGAGPEIPPSFRMRQKWTAMKIEATSGIPMQCQI